MCRLTWRPSSIVCGDQIYAVEQLLCKFLDSVRLGQAARQPRQHDVILRTPGPVGHSTRHGRVSAGLICNRAPLEYASRRPLAPAAAASAPVAHLHSVTRSSGPVPTSPSFQFAMLVSGYKYNARPERKVRDTREERASRVMRRRCDTRLKGRDSGVAARSVTFPRDPEPALSRRKDGQGRRVLPP